MRKTRKLRMRRQQHLERMQVTPRRLTGNPLMKKHRTRQSLPRLAQPSPGPQRIERLLVLDVVIY
jgi:hypothetical protein